MLRSNFSETAVRKSTGSAAIILGTRLMVRLRPIFRQHTPPFGERRSLLMPPGRPPKYPARRQAGSLFNLVPSTWDVFNFTAVEAMAFSAARRLFPGRVRARMRVDRVDGQNGYVFPLAQRRRARVNDRTRSRAASPAQLADIGRGGASTTIRRDTRPSPTVAAQRVAAYQFITIDAFRNRRPSVQDDRSTKCAARGIAPATMMLHF